MNNLHLTNGSPDVPGGHLHSKLPGLFVHMAEIPHLPFGPNAWEHSLISNNKRQELLLTKW